MNMSIPQAQRGLELVNIHCSSCGAPAAYDIVKRTYTCAYCGSATGIDEALKQKKGFRSLRQRTLQGDRGSFDAKKCTCTGCGAEIVIPQSEVLQSCSFCGRALVRGEYLKIPEFPELIIPFRLTPDEARERFLSWCNRNAARREAKHLREHLDDMQGYYLPYELVRGPIDCDVTREGATRSYECGGFLNSVFVNTSEQLDNLTLNGMEPFDLSELREFDFGYLAQQKAKVDEIGAKALGARVREEVAASYCGVVQKTLETKNIEIAPHSDKLLRMPVLLPVYYISAGNVCAAVNGQTGKVAVRSETTRKTMPWYIRPIAATLVVFAMAFAIARALLGNAEGALIMGGAITLVMGLIFYTAFSNAYQGQARKTLDPKIFTSNETFERSPSGELRPASQPIAEDPVEPLFFENVDGARTQVTIRFTTPWRMFKMVLLGLVVLALPTLIAFVLNGLSFHGLHPEGSAVWLCIFAVVVPAYFIKLGRIDIYGKPYVYTVDEQGRKRRVKTESRANAVRDGLRMLLSPSLVLVALALLLFLVMGVYLTLGG